MNTLLIPDLNIGAFLLVRGFRLESLERVGRRLAFRFSGEAEAQEAVQDYHHGGTVVARDFAQALKQLKDRLYSEKFSESANFAEEFSGNGNGDHEQQYRR